MKTKLLFTIILLTLLLENLFSQTYIPMLNNSSWNIESATFLGSQNFVINPGVDVVIGSYTYKKFIDPTIYGANKDVFLREDISTKRVYRNINGVDQLLYDFSLNVSDNIILGNGQNYTVSSITNVNVNGGTRRRIHLDDGFFSETWIEGVGSNNHPLKPFYELPSDPYIYLTCSAQNGISIYNHGLANGGNPSDCSMLLSIDDINYVKEEINFSPNPFKAELLITTNFYFENSTLKLFNSLGQLVKEINNINGQNIIIKRENLNSGIYFTQFIQNGKLISTDKIIISD
ncbi:MAG TPA: T9SS type A sorting domain-containing protein [Flavobacterium sp.]|nr:T9SS type A sorting domain-containing protein [Flavobacterium sp.]